MTRIMYLQNLSKFPKYSAILHEKTKFIIGKVFSARFRNKLREVYDNFVQIYCVNVRAFKT